MYCLRLWKSVVEEDIISGEINFILKPIVEKLREYYGSQANLEKKLSEMLLEMRSQFGKLQGYAEINIINLQKVNAIAKLLPEQNYS